MENIYTRLGQTSHVIRQMSVVSGTRAVLHVFVLNLTVIPICVSPPSVPQCAPLQTYWIR